MSRVIAFLVGLIVMLLAAPASAQAPRKVTIAVIPGVQDLITSIMEREQLFKKYHLDAQIQKVVSPTAVHPMIAEGKVDIGFGGFTVMAIARSQGRPVIVFSVMFSPNNFVLVLNDSPLKSVADLRGKKIGIFGGPGATTSAILFIIGKRWHGVDLTKDAQLITAPSPALAALLDKKELDTALLGTNESLQLFLTGKYRILLDLSEEWERRVGRAPAHVSMDTTEAFAKAHPDILRDFLRAYRDTVRLLRERPELYEHYAKILGIATKDGIALLRERLTPRIIDVWDRKQMDAQNQFLEFMIDVLGEKFLKAVPAGLMTDAYNP